MGMGILMGMGMFLEMEIEWEGTPRIDRGRRGEKLNATAK